MVQLLHTEKPVEGAALPAAQGEQTVIPRSGPKVPEGHGEHCACPGAFMKLPGVHSEQNERPELICARPVSQEVHAVALVTLL